MTATQIDILVVDDEPLICDVISACFEDWPGTRVDCAMTGSIGAEKIRQGAFDLAVIDALLPEIPGLALAELAAKRNLPVLLLSGHPEITEKLEMAGFPVLPKPFALADLLARSRQAIAGAGDNIRRVRESAALMKLRGDALAASMARSRALLEASQKRDGES